MFHEVKKMHTQLILDDSKVPEERNLHRQHANGKYSFYYTLENLQFILVNPKEGNVLKNLQGLLCISIQDNQILRLVKLAYSSF